MHNISAISGFVDSSFQTMPIPAMIAVPSENSYQVILHNEAFQKEIGYAADEINTLEKWFAKAYPDPEYRDQILRDWMKQVDQLKGNRIEAAQVIARVATVHGSQKWFDIRANIKEDIHLVLFFDVDLLEEKKIELQNAYQNLENVLSVIAHDLRSPLNRVKGLVNLIRLEVAKGNSLQSIEEYLHYIESSCDNSLDVLSNMLNFHQLDHEAINVGHIIEFRVLDLLKAIAFHQKSELRLKQQNLELKGDEDLTFTTDQIKLKQVVSNLLSNAIKYSPTISTIKIRYFLKGGALVIEVIDQGQGFYPDELTKVFNRFPKMSSKPTSGERSIGLGLFICKTLTQKLGGDIQIKSKGKHKGSIFRVLIPSKVKVTNYPSA
ncbi:MAG: HAMP domain-containing histidine kinase [Cyclobacteriaceae bacterium]|nr:HAMP domain-containing histidine kinase [Cyclobacteriaceae bacterium]MCH8515200.1 HAMP domain-containing histidine kinase [Cyclobacteriaceae bacterium]